jgi:predicted HTH transcriptional regulator
VLETIAAFLNTDGGDLLIGVADDKSIVGTEVDRFENEDKFLLHLSHVIGSSLGDRAGTLIDAKIEIINGKEICLVSCRRSPEPVFFKWKGIEEHEEGDFYVRSGPQTVKLDLESTAKYIKTRFQEDATTSNHENISLKRLTTIPSSRQKNKLTRSELQK